MPIPIDRIDAFADAPFHGNPAVVCRLAAPADAAWMQRVAAEMNCSETAFVVPRADGFDLRWFTPTMEVDLCGHATLAAAHALWAAGATADTLVFHTRSGALPVRRDGYLIVLDFPADPPRPASPPEALLDALGVLPQSVLRGRSDWLVEVASAEEVRALAPDLNLLASVPARGVIVTAAGDDSDVISRFFAPAAGIAEDPVTGSAHCTLAPFWSRRLGRTRLTAFQASARGGRLRLDLIGDRVHIAGRAVTVARGELLT